MKEVGRAQAGALGQKTVYWVVQEPGGMELWEAVYYKLVDTLTQPQETV